jgi:pimeloyl-ACP methyl ester carboxylesterase
VAPPDRLIYLQHGFLARGPWYSYTAAALAEQTHSIVVAPSITSNFLASDACWLGGNAMHEAMARLFDDNNTALADSAAAAGYSGAIPDRVVLIGHSLGGGAVIGIAGAMADNETEDRLDGVIMLDGVPFDPKAAESIEKVDPDIPIYNLAAPRYFWNQFGVGTDALLEARPGEFIGVTLANGSHVDSMRGGNPLIQFGQELVAGFVEPENGDAAQILMIDWANGMFAGLHRDPITEAFTIDTPSGEATAVPLPNSLTKEFFLNPLQAFISQGNSFFVIEPACVKESMGKCSASVAA